MTGATSTDARREAIALGMFLVWALGAWQSHTFGLWLAIGSTAMFLGVVASCLDGRALVASLRCEPRPLAIGAVVGLGMIVATKLVFTPLAVVLPVLVSDTRELYGAFGEIGPWAPFVLLPLVVAGEEIVWRGVVYRALDGRMKWPAVVLIGTALYGLAHAPVGSPVLVLACLCVGVCWNALRYWTDSLAAVFVAHMLWDLSILVFSPLVPID
jgi:membrane protease YdiL (CAAX protease family)